MKRMAAWIVAFLFLNSVIAATFGLFSAHPGEFVPANVITVSAAVFALVSLTEVGLALLWWADKNGRR